MLKKILALLLVVLMAAPAIVACGNTSDTPKQTINYETEEGGEENAEEDPLIGEIDEYVAELASQYSFKGETFAWIGPNGWEAPEKDEETGDAVDDARYFRQREIEDAYGREEVPYTCRVGVARRRVRSPRCAGESVAHRRRARRVAGGRARQGAGDSGGGKGGWR